MDNKIQEKDTKAIYGGVQIINEKTNAQSTASYRGKKGKEVLVVAGHAGSVGDTFKLKSNNTRIGTMTESLVNGGGSKDFGLIELLDQSISYKLSLKIGGKTVSYDVVGAVQNIGQITNSTNIYAYSSMNETEIPLTNPISQVDGSVKFAIKSDYDEDDPQPGDSGAPVYIKDALSNGVIIVGTLKGASVARQVYATPPYSIPLLNVNTKP